MTESDFDPFNSYRWNRKNVSAGNSRIDKEPWFEWWYYKVVLPETKKSFYFVYGVVNPWDHTTTMKGTRSYVGMGDFGQNKIMEAHYPISEFNSSYESTYVSVAGNIATDKHITGKISEGDGITAVWDITFKNKWTFNAEGGLTGRMVTNIEWYPAQADAQCSGVIESDGITYKFQDAPCYQDRNWGTSFPSWWTWIVSNHFEGHPETALAIGGGKPKVIGAPSPYEGVSVGLRHLGKVYEFSPFKFNNVKVNVSFGKWEVVGKNSRNKIEISAFAPKEQFMDLQFMTPEGEIFHDYETLTGHVTVKLYEKTGLIFGSWKLMTTLESNFAGIEYGSHEQSGFSQVFHGVKKLQ